MHRSEVPQTGTLDGVRVVFAAPSIAGPFFGTMCADHGADVIWIEQASSPAIDRSGVIGFLDADRKNMRNLALNIPSPEGREIFLSLLKETDIFLESSKGGTYEKWGLTDDVLWDVNPRLVIIHVSGFGLKGDPDYINRASYDPIAQAFGGMMYTNSIPGQKPTVASPFIADYYTGLFAFGSGLAAYIKMLKTGVGESIEVSQYEAVVRCLNFGYANWNCPPDSPDAELRRFKSGSDNNHTAGYNSYLCADNNYVYVMIIGESVMRKAFPILGLTFGSEETPIRASYKDYSPEGKILEQAIVKYCSEHTAAEVEKELSSRGCPAICAISYDEQLTNPHYIARNTLTSIKNSESGKDIIIPNIYPRMTNNPAAIWRSAPSWGEDSHDILEDLGFSEEKIAELNSNKIIHLK